MKKRSIILLSLALVLLGSTLFYFLSSSDNDLSVAVGKGLDKSQVKIELGFYSISEESDTRLIGKGLREVVFDGNKSASFETICGENDFLITYGDEYYTIIRHFILNNFTDGMPDPHDYRFSLKKSEVGILVSLEIIGTDGQTIKREMAKVKEAKQNSWGALRESD